MNTLPRLPRRSLLAAGAVLGLFLSQAPAAEKTPIDREALVKRHNPVATKLDPLSPFTVGNGDFAFTADITGLQTFADPYDKGIPLHTQSQWGWHSFPNTEGYKIEDALVEYDVHGRKVPYASKQEAPASDYLRGNPHRLDLGRIGLVLKKKDGALATPEDLSKIKQTLDVWSGLLTSEFEFDGQPVRVRTASHPDRDQLAVEIESPLVKDGRVGVSIAFPGAKAEWKLNTDWTTPDAHKTVMKPGKDTATFTRTLDDTRYVVNTMWSPGAELKEDGPHKFRITAPGRDHLWLVNDFSQDKIPGDFPDAAATFQASADHWKNFWSTGGAIDLSGSTDSRAKELERRIVLSQYLLAIQCAGDMPPQETGLTFNSWFGKPHTEMHWWHAAQFALWGREDMLEKSLPWYQKILPAARALAKRQGYEGARWPKMVGPSGEESPSSIAAFLIWEQPHPIYYAELVYRAHLAKDPKSAAATLEKYKNIVFESAEFMASYAWWNEEKKRYELGPALIPAQECYDPKITMNPTYELAYWYWGLDMAQKWRERLGMKRDAKWDKVMNNLARPTVRDGIYTAVENAPYTETHDHPSMLGALGFLPQTPLIDPATMDRTLDWTKKVWDWPTTWGWDYPIMAMTATRLGRPDDAIDALLMDVQKNTYLSNGHNYQDERLPVYLPGNGGLLATVALMAAGWDGAPSKDAPGFPKDGKWKVRSEGLLPMP
jgi:protein-glucosylgalactosylhydroxylysine glucosidase